jgi:hypothetical protein
LAEQRTDSNSALTRREPAGSTRFENDLSRRVSKLGEAAIATHSFEIEDEFEFDAEP